VSGRSRGLFKSIYLEDVANIYIELLIINTIFQLIVQVKHFRVCVLGALKFKSAIYLPDTDSPPSVTSNLKFTGNLHSEIQTLSLRQRSIS
jgi:hypothetical protein